MKLVKLALLASLIGVAGSAMANEVTIENVSNHPVPVRYQFAYHNPGQSVVYKGISETVVYGNSNIKIEVPTDTYKHAGITVLAVKKDLTDPQWHTLPESARQFDGEPGCWISTNAKRASGNIIFTVFSYGKKHESLTCSTQIAQ